MLEIHPHSRLEIRFSSLERGAFPCQLVIDDHLVRCNLQSIEGATDHLERHSGSVLACRIDEHRRRDVAEPFADNGRFGLIGYRLKCVPQHRRAKYNRWNLESRPAKWPAVLPGN